MGNLYSLTSELGFEVEFANGTDALDAFNTLHNLEGHRILICLFMGHQLILSSDPTKGIQFHGALAAC